MNAYQIAALVLLCGPLVIGFFGFLARWNRLAPKPVESHAKVWGRRCPRCQSEDFAPSGDGRQKCRNCGHEFI